MAQPLCKRQTRQGVGLPFTSPYRRAHYGTACIRTLLTIPGRERAACLLFGLTARLSRLTVLPHRHLLQLPVLSSARSESPRLATKRTHTIRTKKKKKKPHWLDGPPQLLLRTRGHALTSARPPLQIVQTRLDWLVHISYDQQSCERRPIGVDGVATIAAATLPCSDAVQGLSAAHLTLALPALSPSSSDDHRGKSP